MIRVLGLGDNVCDVYLHKGIMYPGGQALTFAVYARRLGASSDFMGVFGSDEIGEYNKKILGELEIGYSHCRTYVGENGFARVTIVDGDRVFKGSNRGGVIQAHPIFLDAADKEYIGGFSAVHTTNNGFLDGLLPELKELPPLVSYDFSYRWNEEDRVERVCPNVDIAFLSCADLDDCQARQLLEKLHGYGTAVVVGTRGSRGAIVYDGSRFYTQLPHLVQPVDTMGAGDSFATAMIVTILQEMEDSGKNFRDSAQLAEAIPKALEKAAEFSAQTCLVDGAFGFGTEVPARLRPRIYGDVFQ